jgi:hypothetical protein
VTTSKIGDRKRKAAFATGVFAKQAFMQNAAKGQSLRHFRAGCFASCGQHVMPSGIDIIAAIGSPAKEVPAADRVAIGANKSPAITRKRKRTAQSSMRETCHSASQKKRRRYPRSPGRDGKAMGDLGTLPILFDHVDATGSMQQPHRVVI